MLFLFGVDATTKVSLWPSGELLSVTVTCSMAVAPILVFSRQVTELSAQSLPHPVTSGSNC